MMILNGKEIKKEPSKGFFYGFGCFETIAGMNFKPLFLEEHLKRLGNSLKYMGIECNYNFREDINVLIKKSELKSEDEFFIKIAVSDSDYFIKIDKIVLRYEEEGAKLKAIDNFYQNEFGFIKSFNFTVNLLARQNLIKEGYYEGIFKNRLGKITEGTISNLFFVKDGVVKTPSLSLNILPGIVRGEIIEILKKNKMKIEEGEYSIEELKNADEIFITNSLCKKGVVWINEFSGYFYKKGFIASYIEKEYLKLV